MIASAIIVVSCDDSDNPAPITQTPDPDPQDPDPDPANCPPVEERERFFVAAEERLMEGRNVFRNDTFGSEAFWGEQLRLHEAIAGEANGGIGAGVSPRAALALGLKVDADALPEDVIVIQHYDAHFDLGLDEEQRLGLTEYLKSL